MDFLSYLFLTQAIEFLNKLICVRIDRFKYLRSLLTFHIYIKIIENDLK